MADLSWHQDAAKTARILQFIVGAMILGLAVFLVIALGIGPLNKSPHSFPAVTVLCLIAFMLVAVGLVARSIVLRVLTAKARWEIVAGTYRPIGGNQWAFLAPAAETEGSVRDARYLLTLFQIRTIISAALCEAWAFFAIIAYLVEGNYLSLALGIAIILFLGAHFPSSDRVIRWVDWELETLESQAVPQFMKDK